MTTAAHPRTPPRGRLDGLPSISSLAAGPSSSARYPSLSASADQTTPSLIGSSLSRRPSARDWLGHGPATPHLSDDERQVASNPSSAGKAKASPIPLNIITHPLFSYHAQPIPETDGYTEELEAQPEQELSRSFFSDPGVGPSSPIQIADMPDTNGGARRSSQNLLDPPLSQPTSPFSPASAFLQNFSPESNAAHRFQAPKGSPPYPDGRMLSPGPGRNASPPKQGRQSEAGTLAEDSMGAVVLDYVLGKVIGRGGFSTVRLAIHQKTGEKFACRIVKRDDLSDTSGSLENFELELALWQSLPPHPSLLPLLEMHRTGYATYLISPFLSGGSLLDILKRDQGSEVTARRFFGGAVKAVQALHEGYEGEPGGILHGDLKLDNFLVGEDGRIVLCDFGLAQRIKPTGDPRAQGQKSRDPSREGRRSKLSSPYPTAASATMPISMASQQQARGTVLDYGGLGGGGIQHPQGIHHHMPSRHHHSPAPHSPSPHGQGGRGNGYVTPVKDFPSASLPYAPPELLSHRAASPALSQDIWALGIVLHALLTSRLPFVDAFDPRLIMKIIKGDFKMPEVGDEWRECLLGLLEPDKHKRWTVEKLAVCDAVTGWRSVTTRGKSRSRSRARRDELDIESRKGFVDHPVYTPPEERGRRGKRPESRERRGHSTSRNRLAVVVDDVADQGSDSYFRGGSGSRSRSRGRGEGQGVFPLDIPGSRSHSGVRHSRSPGGGGWHDGGKGIWANGGQPSPLLATHEESAMGPIQDACERMSMGDVDGRGSGMRGAAQHAENRSRSRTRKAALGPVDASTLGSRSNSAGRSARQ